MASEGLLLKIDSKTGRFVYSELKNITKEKDGTAPFEIFGKTKSPDSFKENLYFANSGFYVQGEGYLNPNFSPDQFGEFSDIAIDLKNKGYAKFKFPDENFNSLAEHIKENLSEIMDLSEVGKEKSFKIYLTRSEYSIEKIHDNYNEVIEGERIAIFGSSGFLEIAINKGVKGSGGGASQLFGISINDIITIEFKE